MRTRHRANQTAGKHVGQNIGRNVGRTSGEVNVRGERPAYRAREKVWIVGTQGSPESSARRKSEGVIALFVFVFAQYLSFTAK